MFILSLYTLSQQDNTFTKKNLAFVLHILCLVETSADYPCISIQKGKKDKQKQTQSEEIKEKNIDGRIEHQKQKKKGSVIGNQIH